MANAVYCEINYKTVQTASTKWENICKNLHGINEWIANWNTFMHNAHCIQSIQQINKQTKMTMSEKQTKQNNSEWRRKKKFKKVKPEPRRKRIFDAK